MFNSKFVLFALLLLAVDVFAIRINYVSKYKGTGMDGKPAVLRETKNGGTIADAKGDEVVKDMPEWSHHKYTASKSGKAVSLITVTSSTEYENKNGAVDANNDMQQIVNSHK